MVEFCYDISKPHVWDLGIETAWIYVKHHSARDTVPFRQLVTLFLCVTSTKQKIPALQIRILTWQNTLSEHKNETSKIRFHVNLAKNALNFCPRFVTKLLQFSPQNFSFWGCIVKTIALCGNVAKWKDLESKFGAGPNRPKIHWI